MSTMKYRWFNYLSVLLSVLQLPPLASAEQMVDDDHFKFSSVEKQLIKSLLQTYVDVGKIGRPVKNVSQTLFVEYGLSLFQLLHLDEKNQRLIVNVWNKFIWKDELLVWNPEQHKGITHVRIPIKHIWKPDIVLYNFADLRLEEFREVLSTVDYTGMVFWSPPAIYKSHCGIDMRYFPFDQQVCFLRFASWTLDGKQMDLNFFENIAEASLAEYSPSNEWRIVAKPAIRRFFNQTHCKASFPNLIFFFVLQRNPVFYAYLLVLPCVLLAFLNLVTFWLPPQQPARMMIGMNIIVSFCILMKFVTASTPSASNTIPYIGYYCCLNMVLIAISTFISLIAVNLHFRCNKTKPLPVWVAKATRFASRILCLGPGGSQPQPEDSESTNVNKLKHQAVKKRCFNPGQTYNNNQNNQSLLACRCACPKCCQLDSTAAMVNPYTHAVTYQRGFVKAGPETPERLPNNGTVSAQLEANLCEIKRALRNLMNKVEEKDRGAKHAGERAMVALAIDRFCFWIYLLVISVTACGLLIPPTTSFNEQEIIQNFDSVTNIGI